MEFVGLKVVGVGGARMAAYDTAGQVALSFVKSMLYFISNPNGKRCFN